jgi:hypothetical protein
VRAVAARIGITEGQAYTVVTGLVVGVVLLALGLPALTTGGRASVAAGSRPSVAVPLAEVAGSPALADAVSPAPTDPPSTGTAGETPTGGVDGGLVLAGPSAPAVSTAPPTSALPSGATPTTPTAPPSTPKPAPYAVTLGRYVTGSTLLVPPGSPGQYLPVELQAGRLDKESFVRVTGQGPVLTLTRSTTPGHQLDGTGDIVVSACALLGGDWDFADGASPSAAPAIDGSACAVGRATPTGVSFDLSSVSTRNGLALVPSGPTTSTGRITFLGVAG